MHMWCSPISKSCYIEDTLLTSTCMATIGHPRGCCGNYRGCCEFALTVCKNTTEPAAAVSTGGVSGGANVTVTAAVEVPESALLQISFNCS